MLNRPRDKNSTLNKAKGLTISDRSALSARWLQKNAAGQSRRDEVLTTLRSNCKKGSRERPGDLDLQGINLSGEDLTELDLSGYDLSYADLTGANLSGSNLSRCRLHKVNLNQACIDNAELLGADLSESDLNECHAERSGFGATNLSGANLFNAHLAGVSLSNSDLSCCDLRAVNLQGAHIRRADLTQANLSRANLQNADFEESNVKGASFMDADLREARLRYIRHFSKATWIRADIRLVDFCGAYMVRRFIMDENYLFEFRSRSWFHEILYWLWWLTSDCGRSIVRWTIMIWIVLLSFALLYTFVQVDYGEYETALSPVYFSLVTFTTLGYGDNIPASLPAQIMAGVEVILGYVALGGLLSIMATKIARRAD